VSAVNVSTLEFGFWPKKSRKQLYGKVHHYKMTFTCHVKGSVSSVKCTVVNIGKFEERMLDKLLLWRKWAKPLVLNKQIIRVLTCKS